MSALDAALQAELQRLRASALYRTPQPVRGAHGAHLELGGRRCVNFCSNDYLGLAADARIAAAAAEALGRCGTGSGAAALVSGYDEEHRRLEEALAAFTGHPRALLFSSGWAANVGALRALLGRGDTLLADELNHASLIDGGRLSGARYVRVAHADAEAFAAAVPRTGGGRVLIATDSLFSMDGDLAPLAQLAELRARDGALLMLDDAHAFGVLGGGGRGALEQAGLAAVSADIYVATLGKALGVAGAFVAGSEALVEFLIQRARSWVFSTAPPPALAAAAHAALGIAQAEPERRHRVLGLARRFRDGARQLGLPLGGGEPATPIQPLILGDPARALALSQRLLGRGYWVAAIRPPTVPPGTSRLRVTLSAAHAESEVDGLLEAVAAGMRELRLLEQAA